ncbi:MFS transporter [Ktedonosporobacter rubrisoli]|uniref:MFS transporter n=1 Tax=Ktedonosporobacter rubrisoli TaxID=2509675 RepID=A0A4P6JI33_KTERU|nr:MFS transporter [Ktedonosporobacter rubrisoli]QBD74613.1 MFS transporter [Ktedonosporobacter rubrisoli]
MHHEGDAPKIASLSGARREDKLGNSYAYYIFALLFCINFFYYFDRYLLAGAANNIARELHFGIEGIGYLASAYLIFSTFGIIPLGMWADRTARRNIIALCVAIWGLSAIATGLTWSLGTLFFWRVIGGIGEAGYGPASEVLISDFFGQSRSMRMLSWWSIASLLGFMLGTILGGALGGEGRWRWAFLLTGVIGLALAGLIWRIREPADTGQSTEGVPQHKQVRERTSLVESLCSFLTGWLSLLRIKSLLIVIIMQGGAWFVLYSTGIYLPTLLQQSDLFGLSSADAGLVSGLVGASAGIAGTLLGGYTTELCSRRWSGAGLLIGGIAFLLSIPCMVGSILIGLNGHDLVISSALRFLVSLLLNVFEGVVLAVVQEIVPTAQRASALATFSLIATLLGEAFSSPLIGIVATVIDPTHGQHFLQARAGYELGMALIYTCVPALLIAGLAGLLGARLVKADKVTAQKPC